MNIQEKLVLSEGWDNIYFFTEGIFVHVFAVSLYLVIEKLGLPLKVYGYRYKKLNNALILRAGLPIKTLEKHYGKALIKRDFGYELLNEVEPEEDLYHQWYEAKLAQALIKEQQAQQTNKMKIPKNDAIEQASIKPMTSVPLGARVLLLSEREYEFLRSWQQDKYPSSIESGFIRGLHKKIASSDA